MKDVFNIIADKKQRNSFNQINNEELYGLILRVTESKAYADKFLFSEISDKLLDEYVMYDKNDKIVIEATSGTAAAAAFNFYLKEICHSYVGPINRHIDLPDNPPSVGRTIKNNSPFIFRYFLNYCTFSYSLLYADWEEYERLTDWMLLSGINLYLNIVGHEIVWRDMLMELGYRKDEVSEYICGPAYLPWQWMGNMTSFGGNLPEWWYDKQKELSNRINKKMRAFGAEPILPGYFGMIPQNFKEKHPKSSPISQGEWCDSFQRPSLLLPEDDMFKKVSDSFYKITKKHFGEIHYFSGDPFHEGGETAGVDLGSFGRKIIDNMLEHCKDGIWFLQGWGKNPRRDMLEAIDKENVVIINLSSDKNYSTDDNFNGYPWIFSATSNFGGTRIIAGNLNGILHEPFNELKKDDITNVGIGLTMEAITIDEIIFDAFSYIAINSGKSSEDFLTRYILSRYGMINDSLMEAFTLLADEILALNPDNGYRGRESSFCSRPSLNVKTVSVFSMETKVYYNEKTLEKIYDLLLENNDALKDNNCYRFDLMDISRQINANRGWHLVDKFIDAFKNKDYKTFDRYSSEFIKLFDVQDKIMTNSQSTIFDNYLNHAMKYSNTETDRGLLAFNAVNLLLLWSDKSNPEILIDYAHREWSGLLNKFYKKRWGAYIELMRGFINDPENLPQIDWREFEGISAYELISKGNKN